MRYKRFELRSTVRMPNTVEIESRTLPLWSSKTTSARYRFCGPRSHVHHKWGSLTSILKSTCVPSFDDSATEKARDGMGMAGPVKFSGFIDPLIVPAAAPRLVKR